MIYKTNLNIVRDKNQLDFNIDFSTGCVFNRTESFDSFCTNHQLIEDVRSDFSLRSSVFWEETCGIFPTLGSFVALDELLMFDLVYG